MAPRCNQFKRCKREETGSRFSIFGTVVDTQASLQSRNAPRIE
jgi:hypothetical protein